EYDGTITVLIDKFDGKPLNSPNNIVVKSDNSIWFTDPPPGISGNYEGHVAQQELPTNVYRLDPQTGRATVVVGDIRPNGLCFTPDERKMYIVDFSNVPRVIRVYDVVDSGTKLANGKAFVTCETAETPDGFRCDTDGNLWCGWGIGEGLDGVVVFNPEGKRIGSISLPERSANVCFGGIKRNRLFMAASHSLYSPSAGDQGAIGGWRSLLGGDAPARPPAPVRASGSLVSGSLRAHPSARAASMGNRRMGNRPLISLSCCKALRPI